MDSQKVFNWNAEKNQLLIQERGVSFERIVFEIASGNEVAVLEHPNQEKYPGQKISMVQVDGYVYAVHVSMKSVTPYDAEELEILQAWEAGKLKPVNNMAEQTATHRAAAEATFKKDQRLNIRISSRDLKDLQARALEEGVPYQTFAASVLHKFVGGHLVSRR